MAEICFWIYLLITISVISLRLKYGNKSITIKTLPNDIVEGLMLTLEFIGRMIGFCIIIAVIAGIIGILIYIGLIASLIIIGFIIMFIVISKQNSEIRKLRCCINDLDFRMIRLNTQVENQKNDTIPGFMQYG